MMNFETGTITTIDNNFISKDKIREKIKEVSNGTYDAKIILEKLLEEQEATKDGERKTNGETTTGKLQNQTIS